MASSPVTRTDIEQLWNSLPATASDPVAGLFGPRSLSWRVNRESALFLGAGRASLLQLAHPWVAAALDQHSNLRANLLARFHNTFRVVFTMLFGTLDQALAASRHLYQLHTQIRGFLPAAAAGYPAGSPYQANEVGALLWVYATLIESALLAHDLVLPPLSETEREMYYAESRSMAALFGIPFSALPATWSAFENYVRTMLASDQLGVNALSRELAYLVLHGRGSWIPVPAWYRDLTAFWLPESLRYQFVLPFGIEQQRSVASATSWLPRLYHRLPAPARFVGPYLEATARLKGQRPGLLIRASNRFWMGQSLTMFANAGS